MGVFYWITGGSFAESKDWLLNRFFSLFFKIDFLVSYPKSTFQLRLAFPYHLWHAHNAVCYCTNPNAGVVLTTADFFNVIAAIDYKKTILNRSIY